LKDFLNLCLTKDAPNRPDAIELLQHTFLATSCSPKEFMPIISKAKVLLQKEIDSKNINVLEGLY